MKLDKWSAVAIKLKPELAEQIKKLAEEEGLPPTTLCRVIIRKFVKSRIAEPAQS